MHPTIPDKCMLTNESNHEDKMQINDTEHMRGTKNFLQVGHLCVYQAVKLYSTQITHVCVQNFD